jgi:pilus assembly protein CpaC
MGTHTAVARHETKGNSMKRRLIHTLMTAACAAVPLALTSVGVAHAQSVQRPANDIVLSIGRGQLVTAAGSMTNVFVANDAVADVEVKSTRQLYVFGKSGGETTVYASNAAGDIVWSANVRVGSNIDSVDQMLALAMPDAKISVATMGTNTFLLTGTVAAPEDAAEAERLVQAFVGKDAANVVSRLKMATPLQVNLQVRIAEVSRSLVKIFGVNLTSIDGSGGFKFGVGQGRAGFAPTFNAGRALGTGNTVKVIDFNPLTGLPVVDGNGAPQLVSGSSVVPGDIGTTLAGAGRFLGLNLLGALDAGETVGLVSTLAQPNLTALSGETAEFLAGGEFPIPLSQGLGSTSVEYKKYGVSLAYTPTVLANGRISLRVRPEVSELSSEGAIVLDNLTIPALTVRRAETTIELGSGQSFMIAGLLKSSSQNTIRKMPGAGDLPILGSLFRSTNFQRGETELVIVVTPYLVRPVNTADIRLPTDGYNAPNELQRLLGNGESDGVSGAKRPGPTLAPGTGSREPRPASPVGANEPRSQDGNKPRNRQAGADLPAPGFNLK